MYLYKQTVRAKIKQNNILAQDNVSFTEGRDIEYIVEKIELLTAPGETSLEGSKDNTNAELKYDETVKKLEELIDFLKIPKNVYKFFNIKGVQRVITPIVGVSSERVTKQLLIIIKTLFNVAPSTTTALIPISIVDKLLDIFEHDDNLALKTHALDILYVWLPNNPRVQARVMKLKGLEPFYDQISKLDSTVIYTLLDLFNKILEEHLTVRADNSLKNKDIFNKRNLYEKIGLVERMSTQTVCNGILNIFELILPLTDNRNEQVPKIIINLMKNIKPFCLKIYNRKTLKKAYKVFEGLKSYFTNTDTTALLFKLGFNLTEVKTILEDYDKKLNDNARDEF
ncbi:uncharacterized protein LOC126778061 [Nymphalis io]|uniref:uncharacterized protein LOC126778061 n=1 Tax=Inachis io TaxID=171585 RepID=UPI002166D93C|nr:uncharacterized protein LOC126778061 [Nymphalis io]